MSGLRSYCHPLPFGAKPIVLKNIHTRARRGVDSRRHGLRADDLLFLVARLQYHPEDDAVAKSIRSEWDLWYAFTGHETLPVFGEVFGLPEGYQTKVERAAVIARPLYGIQSIDVVKEMLERGRAAW